MREIEANRENGFGTKCFIGNSSMMQGRFIFIFSFLVVWDHSWWDLSSPARDGTLTSGREFLARKVL